MYAVYYQVQCDAPSFWCSICAVCSSVGYTRCFGRSWETKAPLGPANSHAPPRCRTSQYRMTFIVLSVYLWHDIGDPVFEGVGLHGFKSMGQCFFNWPGLLASFCLLLFSISLLSESCIMSCGNKIVSNCFFLWVGILGLRRLSAFGLIKCQLLSPSIEIIKSV